MRAHLCFSSFSIDIANVTRVDNGKMSVVAGYQAVVFFCRCVCEFLVATTLLSDHQCMYSAVRLNG